MPSAKRERKREGRDARREAEKAAARRRRQRSIAIRVVVAGAVILGVIFLITRAQGEDEAAAKKAPTTTTVKDSATSTSKAPNFGYGSTSCPPAAGANERTTTFSASFKQCIDPAKTYTAEVTTDVGAYTIALDAKKAPVTVNNFVSLSRHRFYEGVIFHRVIKGFMNQGGDPEGTGSGGPGYEFSDELPEPGSYKVGSVAMANSGPNTNGSQFFVVTGPQGTALPPNYSLFGQVTDGMDTVKKIEADGTEGEGKPTVTHKIVSITITES